MGMADGRRSTHGRQCITAEGSLSMSSITRKIAIIGGTGFGAALVAGTPETMETNYGPASLTRADLGDGLELLFLARHGAGHVLPPHKINHRANVAALRELGADAVFATTAVGSLRPKIAPGDFVILDDFLDFTKGEVVTFYSESGQVRHTDFSKPYDPGLRELLLQTADPELAPRIHPAGTYLCTSGPRYETPAEVRLFGQWASVVGMTGAPEAILCREAGLRYAGVALATNYGTGLLTAAPLSHTEVEAEMAVSRDALAAWLLRAARAVK
jgi:5'-methylthioadenosine phosphorylase